MIKLSHGWVIKNDPLNFILCKIKKKEKGKHIGEEYESEHKYYGTLEQAFNGYITELERQSIHEGVKDIKMALSDIQSVHNAILSEVRGMKNAQ